MGEDHKPSRHLPTVNRRAAARDGDHKHGSRTTNHRGTYRLSTGGQQHGMGLISMGEQQQGMGMISEQQQGMVIISMGRGPQTIKALTDCQQEGSSNGWGS
ncbi:hypothetical protein P692DRAFT_201874758 [Suillus brevipes Sb2]|nr:hypothetical protein P692DRAFT_201874758 [Suillus brevipes Sb2]